jgi:predicted TIM-barrel fold metal-dependent hydrolase
MIIDCHTHLAKLPEDYSKELLEDYDRAWAHKGGGDMNKGPQDHLRAMGVVEKAIVFGLKAKDSGFWTTNDYIADYVKSDPEKLIGFASVDPNHEDALMEIKRSVKTLGLKGLKMGPIYQHFDPTDKKYYPIWELAQELGLPIIIHQGTTFVRNAPLKYAFPILLEDIALSFPDLIVVVAHMGHPWEEETIALIRKQPNFYSDVSALIPRPYRFYNDLVLAMEYGVLDKLIFGSDYPIFTPAQTMEGLQSINSFVKGTNLPKIPEEAINNIISRNAERALKKVLVN